MRNRFFAFAFDQLEDRPVAGTVMTNFKALTGELGNQFLHGRGLVPLNNFSASAAALSARRRFPERKQFLPKVGIEQIKIEVFMMKLANLLFIVKIMDGLLVSFSHLHQIRRELARLGIAFPKISFKIATVPADCFA